MKQLTKFDVEDLTEIAAGFIGIGAALFLMFSCMFIGAKLFGAFGFVAGLAVAIVAIGCFILWGTQKLERKNKKVSKLKIGNDAIYENKENEL